MQQDQHTFEFQPDVRSFGAVQRKEIELSSGYIFMFSDVFDFDTPPFIAVDVYDRTRKPLNYACVIDGGWLKSLTWTQNIVDEVIAVSNTGTKVKVFIDGDLEHSPCLSIIPL